MSKGAWIVLPLVLDIDRLRSRLGTVILAQTASDLPSLINEIH
jgi:hypothetical protein